MKRRKALGRGLSAILPETSGVPGLQELPIEALEPGLQPRKNFDEARIRELADSIRNNGLIQPIVARRIEKGRYRIVAGERRWRAARLAGLETVPVILRETTDEQAFALALVENLQREDLNPLEEAEAYRRLVEEYGHTHEEVAAMVGRNRSTVANALRLLLLPERVKELLLSGELTPGHARAVLMVDGTAARVDLAERIAAEGLSVRQAEHLARKAKAGSRPGQAAGRPEQPRSPDVRALEERLQRRFQTRVRLRHRKGGKGRIEIEYHSLDELDRLLDKLMG